MMVLLDKTIERSKTMAKKDTPELTAGQKAAIAAREERARRATKSTNAYIRSKWGKK
jgi:hypothetical protein